MGQYYKPVLRSDNKSKTSSAWYFDCGAKLMEHSYVGNPLVESVMCEIDKNTSNGNLTRVVWAGDYANEEMTSEDNLYKISLEYEKINPSQNNCLKRYIVNEDRMEYVDLSKCKKDTYDYIIHPLPLLTAEGCGRGGGDYDMHNGKGKEFVGTWARCCLKLTDTQPNCDFIEIVPDFILD